MSSATRRKSHNSISKTSRPRSKKKKSSKKQNQRASTNSIRVASPKHKVPSPRGRNSNHLPSLAFQYENNGYHEQLLDIDRDSPPASPGSPSSRPTHKKNAVSSFLSIFTTFSNTKRRKDSSIIDIHNMSDLELLKRMKRGILDVLGRIMDPKLLRRAKAVLKAEVWEIQYSELKKRLSTHDIHTATIRQKLASAQSLKQLSSLHVNHEGPNDDEDEDAAEMANYLLHEYFDEPTQNEPFEYINVQRQENKKDGSVSTAIHAIAERETPTISKSDAEADREDSYNDSDGDDSYMDYNDDEKKHVMTPFEDTPVDENKERDFKYKEHLKKRKKHKKNKNKKYTKDDSHIPSTKRKSKSRKFSPRPLNDKGKGNHIGFGSIPDKKITIIDGRRKVKKRKRNQHKHHAHRIEIRNKFRRGVRKAMLVNAWSGITKQTVDIDTAVVGPPLALLNMPSDGIGSNSNNDSQSHTSCFMPFMSDGLMHALSKVGTWDFDAFEFCDTPEIGGKCLVFAVLYIFDKYDLFKLFPSISPKKFMKFLTVVEDGYLDNPYHNKIHACDVVSNVAYYLNNTQFFAKHISAFDKFTAIISAAVHDLGHDGNNNAYHITTMSDFAVTYNDLSVLENYHIAYTFRILKRTDCNWYNQLSGGVQKYLRAAMIDIVLATDMKFHNQKLAQLTGLVAILKQKLNKKILLRDSRDSIGSITSMKSIPIMSSHNIPTGSTSSLMSDIMKDNNELPSQYTIKPKTLSDFPLYKYKVNQNGVEHLLKTEIDDIMVTDADPRVVDVHDERRFILCWLMHLCDISNCAKPLKSGKKWAVRLITEFFKQGDRERALGLKVSAMMDRRRSSPPQSQIGFIKFILRPSYDMFARLVPEASIPLEILNQNLEYWKIQQSVISNQRKKRARSVGSINQTPALMMIQDQLKMLANRNSMDMNDDEDNDDAASCKSVEIKDIDHNNSQIMQTVPSRKSSQSKKHVGFKDILIIASQKDKDRDREKTLFDAYVKSPEIIFMDNESEINTETPTTISKHRTALSKSSHYSGFTNYSIDSMDSSTPLSGKVRAHSIHVSIPTSEKQIQSQPQPFSELLADLKKEYEHKEDKEYNKTYKRRERTAAIMHMIHNNSGQRTPKVKQSVSVPVGVSPRGVVAEITISDDDDDDITPMPSNNKQVFDVV